MAERDAFGREIGEDSLAAMGWGTGSARPTPADAPAVAAEPAPQPAREITPPAAATPPPADAARVAEAPPVRVTPPPRPASPRPVTIGLRRPRRRRGTSLGFFIVLMLVLVGLGGGLFSVARDAVDDIQGAIEPATVAPPAPGESLLNPKPLKAALAKLPPGTLQTLRVAPERIDAEVFSDGSLHVVQVRSGGGLTDVKTGVAVRQPKLRVDAQAPRRMARAAAKQAGRPVDEVSYLVLGRTGWDLFFADGRHYSGGPSGRHVKHIG
jgi:hypothetical protein